MKVYYDILDEVVVVVVVRMLQLRESIALMVGSPPVAASVEAISFLATSHHTKFLVSMVTEYEYLFE